jgi:hypothetical protein
MTWPQVVILVMMSFSIIVGPIMRARDRRNSSEDVALYAVSLLAVQAFYAWVLHEGGFW